MERQRAESGPRSRREPARASPGQLALAAAPPADRPRGAGRYPAARTTSAPTFARRRSPAASPLTRASSMPEYSHWP